MTRSIDAMRRAGIYCVDDTDPSTLAVLDDDIRHDYPRLQAYVGAAADRHGGLLIWMR